MLIYFYSNLMLINDINRSGASFITSSVSNLYFCAIFASFYSTNCFCLAVSSPILHAACLIIEGLVYLVWYRTYGYKLYLNSHLQRSLDLLISLICVVGIQILEISCTGSVLLGSDNLLGVTLAYLIISAVIIKYTRSRF